MNYKEIERERRQSLFIAVATIAGMVWLFQFLMPDLFNFIVKLAGIVLRVLWLSANLTINMFIGFFS